MKRVSVVILNWNGRHFLERFLPSLMAFTPRDYAEVVVADNGSTDDSIVFLKKFFPEVRLILLDRNYGFTGGYNRALAQLESDYFVLLNSDVEVTQGWLVPLVDLMESDENIAAVMPKIRSYDRREYFEYAGACGGLIDIFGFPYCRGRILNRIERDKGQYDTPVEIFWASGAAMFVRAELYKRFGGLDESYFAHMEEIDLCWRLKNAGYKIMVEPASVVYHVGGGTLPNESPRKLYLNFRNNLSTLYKNLPGMRLFPIMFIRMCMDGMIALGYLFKGKFSFFKAVLKAHIGFYRQLPQFRVKRKAIPVKCIGLTGMLKGSLAFLLLKKQTNE